MSNQIFQILKELPTPLCLSQCVLHKHEILICGSWDKRACYSYDIIKNEYKFICDYPSDITLEGHCVVKLVDNNSKDSSQITLLSFGGLHKHTLIMRYQLQSMVPFKDNHNHPIIIGRNNDYYIGVRAVIGGGNNNLLFITYYEKNISVFDLNTFQFIKHDTLPDKNYVEYYCLVSNLENRQEMMKTNKEKHKQKYQMLLFCKDKGLSIEYDEDNNTLQFHQLPVCDEIAPFKYYAYVCINDVILFFGGFCYKNNNVVSKSVHKYSIRENKWMTFENTLPSPLYYCVAIFTEEDSHIHIIGGLDDKKTKLSTHMKTKLRIWDVSLLVMICLFIYFDETQIN
ncbi:hypothetical protein RFI_02295 [Reticulomyxa filosa]|uniref:Kelch motif family protein n=1 Tax=Reticulomyxa filosa TaxID=46433 RepID=X6P8B4_RETFI|nr:hypothetical protein RFI_02295 [Reticulomyxa filosa]|eukprot:ETO34790.1 hypothetical protein RFI_02295 [Reticulomyxa filosa]